MIATVGGMLFGFDISSMSAIIGKEQYVSYFNNSHGTTQGGICAALAGGSVIGAIIADPISNKFGRRDSIWFACVFWLIGTTIQPPAMASACSLPADSQIGGSHYNPRGRTCGRAGMAPLRLQRHVEVYLSWHVRSAWQQLSGANVMTYYVVYIFDMANLTGNVGLISSGFQYAIFLIGTAATFFFIDRTGRRPLLVYGALAMGTCLFVVGGILGSYAN